VEYKLDLFIASYCIKKSTSSLAKKKIAFSHDFSGEKSVALKHKSNNSRYTEKTKKRYSSVSKVHRYKPCCKTKITLKLTL